MVYAQYCLIRLAIIFLEFEINKKYIYNKLHLITWLLRSMESIIVIFYDSSYCL